MSGAVYRCAHLSLTFRSGHLHGRLDLSPCRILCTDLGDIVLRCLDACSDAPLCQTSNLQDLKTAPDLICGTVTLLREARYSIIGLKHVLCGRALSENAAVMHASVVSQGIDVWLFRLRPLLRTKHQCYRVPPCVGTYPTSVNTFSSLWFIWEGHA